MLLVLYRIVALMIIVSRMCKLKIMETEKIAKKMKKNFILQFQTMKLDS